MFKTLLKYIFLVHFKSYHKKPEHLFFNGVVKGRKRIRFGRISTMVIYRNVKRVHCCIDERSKLGRVQKETFRVAEIKNQQQLVISN